MSRTDGTGGSGARNVPAPHGYRTKTAGVRHGGWHTATTGWDLAGLCEPELTRRVAHVRTECGVQLH